MQIEITDKLEHFIEEYQKYQENKKVCEYIQDRIDYDSDYWHELEEKIKDDRHWIEMYAVAIADEITKECENYKKAQKYVYVSDFEYILSDGKIIFRPRKKEAGSDE